MADLFAAPSQWPRSLNVLGVGLSYLIPTISCYGTSAIFPSFPSTYLVALGLKEDHLSLVLSVSFFFIAYVLGEISMEFGARVLRHDARIVLRAAIVRFAANDKSGFWLMKLIEVDRRSELFSGLAGVSLLFFSDRVFSALLGGRVVQLMLFLAVGTLLFVIGRALALASFREFEETFKALDRIEKGRETKAQGMTQ